MSEVKRFRDNRGRMKAACEFTDGLCWCGQHLFTHQRDPLEKSKRSQWRRQLWRPAVDRQIGEAGG